jgi:hypothetical protein
VNPLGNQRSAPAVEVKIQQANIGRGASDPVENRFVIVNPVFSKMPVEPDQRGRISEQL